MKNRCTYNNYTELFFLFFFVMSQYKKTFSGNFLTFFQKAFLKCKWKYLKFNKISENNFANIQKPSILQISLSEKKFPISSRYLSNSHGHRFWQETYQTSEVDLLELKCLDSITEEIQTKPECLPQI